MYPPGNSPGAGGSEQKRGGSRRVQIKMWPDVSPQVAVSQFRPKMIVIATKMMMKKLTAIICQTLALNAPGPSLVPDPVWTFPAGCWAGVGSLEVPGGAEDLKGSSGTKAEGRAKLRGTVEGGGGDRRMSGARQRLDCGGRHERWGHSGGGSRGEG